MGYTTKVIKGFYMENNKMTFKKIWNTWFWDRKIFFSYLRATCIMVPFGFIAAILKIIYGLSWPTWPLIILSAIIAIIIDEKRPIK